ncbi:MAG: glycosyltransferase, partial [Pseudonocardiaceae bacterium]
MVLLEAMAAGTPVVASDITGYRQLAAHGQAAVLVAAGDALALAGALQETLGLGETSSDPSRATKLTIAGRARAEEFSMDRLAEHYVPLYEMAITRFNTEHRDRLARRPQWISAGAVVSGNFGSRPKGAKP